MRKLSRIRDMGIPPTFVGDLRKKQLLKLVKTERDIKNGILEKHKFPSTWSPCKEQLHKESYSKCAYCESPTTVVSYGDVEHYRPKSKYWWLAYCYDNYLASCTLCNQKYKKAKFKTLHTPIKPPLIKKNSTDTYLEKIVDRITPDPIQETDGVPWDTYCQEHIAERPLLLNPYIDDPKAYFGWEVSPENESVRLVPLDAQNKLHKKIVKASEEDYGINRPELCFHRFEAYLVYCAARLISEDVNIPDNYRTMQRRIRERLLRDESAYSGMLQYFEQKPTTAIIIP
ncbi:hypothetical protein ACFO3O_20755 [Dokdonia ponticola]|uniref:HNH nuclease domain-containing protein n=1 Tax=Dokdonia ponticola TaxID=2041041 RepID=A0ABV9I4H9_9FLAO